MKVKFPYSIQRSMIKILPFIATAIMSASCQKEHDVVIDWNWEDNLGYAPPKEMIRNEINKKNVNTVFINLTSPNSTGYSPGSFHRARDTLQTRLDIAPGKVLGMGAIYINPEPGADNRPNHEIGQDPGIAWYDKIWFEQNGWQVRPWVPPRNK